MEAVSSAITAMTHFVSRPRPAWKRAILARGDDESLDGTGAICVSEDINGRGMGRIRFIVAMSFLVKMYRRYDLQRRRFMGHSIDPVLVELSADATWVAKERVPLGPWQLRANQGYTGRANSVRTACAKADEPAANALLGLITQAEAFYRQRNLRPVFQISPATMPRNLDRILIERGYGISHTGELWLADPGEVRDKTARAATIGSIVEKNSLDTEWLACAHEEHAGHANLRDGIYRRVPSPRVFAMVTEKNEPAARVIGTVHDGVGWIYRMTTAPDRQRRGYATRLLNYLAVWILANGGKVICLQVMTDNRAARNLYAKAGFTKQYDYHYRVLR
jgi:N-acetylglutamate synthase